jgi:hypothetical protein
MEANKEAPTMSDTETNHDNDADNGETMALTPEVMGAINQLRQRSELMVSELGRLEVRKMSLVSEINLLNNKASTLLKQEGERLGIPAGAEWRVTPEGNVIVQ